MNNYSVPTQGFDCEYSYLPINHYTGRIIEYITFINELILYVNFLPLPCPCINTKIRVDSTGMF